jgi:hypothetical protein
MCVYIAASVCLFRVVKVLSQLLTWSLTEHPTALRHSRQTTDMRHKTPLIWLGTWLQQKPGVIIA